MIEHAPNGPKLSLTETIKLLMAQLAEKRQCRESTVRFNTPTSPAEPTIEEDVYAHS